MEITITKKVLKPVLVKKRVYLDVKDLKVVRAGSRDFDSTNLVIYYKDIIIGSGHINDKTNWAHISLDEENQELEDYLVKSIESR